MLDIWQFSSFQLSTNRASTTDANDGATLSSTRTTQHSYLKFQPRYLLAKAHQHYTAKKMGNNSRERSIYMKERKALKTIAILFLGTSHSL